MTNPVTSQLRVFHTQQGSHLFVVNGSRIYDVAPEVARRVERSLTGEMQEIDPEIERALGGATQLPRIGVGIPTPPRVHSISLNVAQSCNMACVYCYADEGRFGSVPRKMNSSVAEATIDRLIEGSEAGATLVLGFMGGEPLLNRELVHHSTRYASAAALRSGRKMRFSITTNATLLTREDAELFQQYPFTVQFSLDGNRLQNDALRPMRGTSTGASSSHDMVLRAIRIVNEIGRPAYFAARATVTPRSPDLKETLDYLISLGFDDVGFSAVLVSPNPDYAFTEAEMQSYLAQMIACGRKALGELIHGRHYPFANLETALRELHRGTHRPYACGAGAAYLSANAEGDLFACHRLIDDDRYAMGNVTNGPDFASRQRHLQQTHVDHIEPCRQCWARYLCGGGCQHEVSRRGRISCDFIRGWLDFCLGAYVELTSERPEYFGVTATHSDDRLFADVARAI